MHDSFLKQLADIVIVKVVFASEKDSVHVVWIGKVVLSRASHGPQFDFEESAEFDDGHFDDHSGVERIEEVLHNLNQNGELASSDVSLRALDPVQQARFSVIKLRNDKDC